MSWILYIVLIPIELKHSSDVWTTKFDSYKNYRDCQKKVLLLNDEGIQSNIILKEGRKYSTVPLCLKERFFK